MTILEMTIELTTSRSAQFVTSVHSAQLLSTSSPGRVVSRLEVAQSNLGDTQARAEDKRYTRLCSGTLAAKLSVCATIALGYGGSLMIQEALFAMPIPSTDKSPALAEPLGPCCKRGCSEPATFASPGGSMYCRKHGYCARRACLKSVEKFVMHPRLGIYVCSCVVRFDEEMGRG